MHEKLPPGLNPFVGFMNKSVREIFQVKGSFDVSRKPVVLEKELVSFGGRMRVDGLEKFNKRTAFAAVKFYANSALMEQDKPLGVMVVFVEAEYLSKLLWTLDYPRIDEDDDESVLDACGTLANIFAGHFVKEIYADGYAHLEMSHFESFINTALNGVAFASDQTNKYEISYYIQGQKRVVIELCMGNVPLM